MTAKKTDSGFEVYYERSFRNKLKGFDAQTKSKILEAVGKVVVESIRRDTAAEKSPVNGIKYPKLEKEYAEIKRKKGKGSDANLRLTNDLMRSLKFERIGDRIKWEFEGDENNAKAYGHNTGFRGHPTIKNKNKRKTMPNTNEKFRRAIERKIEDIIDFYIDLNEQEQQISDDITGDTAVIATDSRDLRQKIEADLSKDFARPGAGRRPTSALKEDYEELGRDGLKNELKSIGVRKGLLDTLLERLDDD